MFESLHHRPQHISSLHTCFAYESVANVEQLRKCHDHDLVKVYPVFWRLEPVHHADRQQTFHASGNRSRVLSVEELHGHIEEGRPFVGEVVMKDPLESREQLGTDWVGGGDDYGDYASSKSVSCLLGENLRGWWCEVCGPAFVHAVLQVDGSCGGSLVGRLE